MKILEFLWKREQLACIYPTKIIAVDFDGTLVTAKFPNVGDPIWATIDLLKEEKAKGAKVILWTCRTGEQLEEAITFCKEHDIHLDAVNENLPMITEFFGNDTRKVFADEYWDDRAVDPVWMFGCLGKGVFNGHS